MEALWERLFDDEFDVSPDVCSVSCTISPFGPREYSEKIAEILFEDHEVEGLYLAVPSVLSLYAQGQTTGVVLDSGECITCAIPVCDGFVLQHAVQTLPGKR